MFRDVIPANLVPKDEDDNRFIKAFDLNEIESARNFFADFGFVVFSNIFDEVECKETRHAMWSVLEQQHPKLHRDDEETWGNLKAFGKYGLSTRGPSFHPQLVYNRQSPRLAEALHNLLGGDIWVSHDRFTIYRATRVKGGDAYSTHRNLHLDLNPWWWLKSASEVLDGLDSLQYEGAESQDLIRENNLVIRDMGRHVQCVLNFEDNEAEDGGTLLVPGFHRSVAHWTTTHNDLFAPRPWVDLTNADFIEGRPLLDCAMRVPMRAGSVLVWDQTMVHGSAPNTSFRCRYAQFLKAFPAPNKPLVSVARDGETGWDGVWTWVDRDTVEGKEGGGNGGADINDKVGGTIDVTSTVDGERMEVPAMMAEAERMEKLRCRMRRRAKCVRASIPAEVSLTALGRRIFGLEGGMEDGMEEAVTDGLKI